MPYECHFIVPAGGSGLRMGGALPKQFVEVAGKPILMHTLWALAPFATSLTLALALEVHDYWQELCERYHFDLQHTVVAGGTSRYQSVRNAILTLPEGTTQTLVAVHDAVRPLIAAETIAELLRVADLRGAAIPYHLLVDSIRQRLPNDGSCTVDRSQYVAVETPQVFRLEALRSAYLKQNTDDSGLTDDASLYERYYGASSIALVGSQGLNIKITYPHDLLLLQEVLQPSS